MTDTVRHPTLVRQMKRAGFIDNGEAATADLLARVSRAYVDADEDHYTMERSLSIVSEEMASLNEALRKRSDAIHAATLEASIDGVIVVDSNRRVVAHNRRFADMFSINEVLGVEFDGIREKVARLVGEQHRDGFIARIDEINNDLTLTCVEELNLVDGRVLERTTAPVIVDGINLGRVWFFRDVTAARLSELALRQARDNAEAAARAKSAFLANMSHEMRTPLNSILGFARLINDETADSLSAEQRENFQFVISAGEHLLSLVNDLLDLRNLEVVPERIQCSPVVLEFAIAEAVSLVRPLLSTREHAFEVEMEVPGLKVSADRRALIQILVNLLSNAAKFTPTGGRIVVSAGHCGSGCESEVEVVVRDNGIGIPAAALPSLFTYFAQVNGRADHGLKGSGIGLALTRSLVERMDGRIVVDSEEGTGSSFRVNLKAA